jgi:hypothetical protein
MMQRWASVRAVAYMSAIASLAAAALLSATKLLRRRADLSTGRRKTPYCRSPLHWLAAELDLAAATVVVGARRYHREGAWRRLR